VAPILGEHPDGTLPGWADDLHEARVDLGAASEAVWDRIKHSGRAGELHGRWLALETAEDVAIDQVYTAVARVAGEYLLAEGKTETRRCLYLLLLHTFDLWQGFEEGYRLGDEVAFLRQAGGFAQDRRRDRPLERAGTREG
jgi:hypothetical protein